MQLNYFNSILLKAAKVVFNYVCTNLFEHDEIENTTIRIFLEKSLDVKGENVKIHIHINDSNGFKPNIIVPRTIIFTQTTYLG